MSTTPHHTRKGFTLIELIIVLAVAAIIAVVGVPSMYSMITSNRLATQANELIASINLARSEAIKRSGQIVLCQSNDGSQCDNNAAWNDGWMIFASTDATFDPGETIIRIHSALPSSTAITYTGVDNTIVYSASGRKTGAQASFRLSDNEGAVNAHIVTIDLSGRVRSEIEET